VAAAAYGNRQVVLAREPHSGDNVCNPSATGDQRRVPIDHPVPDFPRFVIANVIGEKNRAAHSFAQGGSNVTGDPRRIELSNHATAPLLIRRQAPDGS
jgi:hypothetical protein